jgi:hypothetical protein
MKRVSASVLRLALQGLGLALIVVAVAVPAVAGGPFPSPEIDPGMMGSAATLLAGGLMLLSGRRRKA